MCNKTIYRLTLKHIHKTGSQIQQDSSPFLDTNFVAHLGLVRLQNAHNHAEKPDGAGEDLDNENFDKQRRILGVGQRRATAHNAHAEAAGQIGETHGETGSEHHVAGGQVQCQGFVIG